MLITQHINVFQPVQHLLIIILILYLVTVFCFVLKVSIPKLVQEHVLATVLLALLITIQEGVFLNVLHQRIPTPIQQQERV